MTRCLLIAALVPVAAPWAAAQAPPTDAAEIWFDIPAQPVASALDAYSAATGIVAAYNGNLAAGRQSSEVKGRLRLDVALPLLLEGSGLVARYTTASAFIVVPAPEDSAAVKSPLGIAQAFLTQQQPAVQRYSGLVQASINTALCAQERTRPGSYRLAVSFWIGSAGDVTRLKLLDTTGDPQRDAAVADTLRHVSIGAPPPPRTAQPFTMLVLPRSSGGTVDCAQSEGGQQRD